MHKEKKFKGIYKRPKNKLRDINSFVTQLTHPDISNSNRDVRFQISSFLIVNINV